MPKIAYIDKTFRDDKLELIGIANGIVAEYEAQGYGLTLRQLYYQMVSRDIIPNNIRSYKNLGNLINDARLAGLVDWHAIEDRTRNLRRPPALGRATRREVAGGNADHPHGDHRAGRRPRDARRVGAQRGRAARGSRGPKPHDAG